MDPSKVLLSTFSRESELDWIITTLRSELSEPYSIFTYSYFLTTWPDLSIVAYYEGEIIGVIIGSLDTINPRKAYIGMLVVQREYRRLKVGIKLFN